MAIIDILTLQALQQQANQHKTQGAVTLGCKGQFVTLLVLRSDVDKFFDMLQAVARQDPEAAVSIHEADEVAANNLRQAVITESVTY